MNKIFQIVLFLLFPLHIVFSQSDSQMFWNSVNESQIVTIGTRYIVPQAYYTLKLDVNGMKNFLSEVSKEFSIESATKTDFIYLPVPDGSLQKFSILESPIMESALGKKYPEIKTYVGKGIDDPFATVRLDFTPLGFHAMILSPAGDIFIDPYSLGDVENYISYYRKDYINENKSFECDLIAEENKLQELEYLKQSITLTPTGPQLRTYRLAVACTGEYAAVFGGTVPAALAAIVTSVNRVNGVYEKEVAVRMVLVANNDTLVFTNASTDPYSNNDGGAMLSQNITTVNARIGSLYYDIGHVFSTGGGGVAYLGCVCGFSKAGGVTGSPSPIGDPFDIDYVAHEMGHQFGGNHSFNGTTGA